MSTANGNAFDRGIDPVLQIVLSTDKARTVIEYRAEESLQQRIEELAEECNEGEFTESEQAEYEGYVRANNSVAIIQAKARKVPASPSG